MVKALKIIGLIFGLIILVLFVLVCSLFSGMCENTIITSSVSPNNKWKVVLFERNCGATTSFSSQISLLKHDEELGDGSGNLYIAQGYPEGYSFNWESNTAAVIKGSKRNASHKLPELNGIKFDYE